MLFEQDEDGGKKKKGTKGKKEKKEKKDKKDKKGKGKGKGKGGDEVLDSQPNFVPNETCNVPRVKGLYQAVHNIFAKLPLLWKQMET